MNSTFIQLDVQDDDEGIVMNHNHVTTVVSRGDGQLVLVAELIEWTDTFGLDTLVYFTQLTAHCVAEARHLSPSIWRECHVLRLDTQEVSCLLQ
ncbi:hypothetical protein D3C80_1801180 [compost metagenome]